MLDLEDYVDNYEKQEDFIKKLKVL